MDMLPIILVLSVVVQLAAAGMAVRLIWITERAMAWGFIALAILFMALRRCLIFFNALFQDAPPVPLDVTSEIVALVTSTLIAVGVALMAPLFRSMKETAERLQHREQEYLRLVTNIPAVVFQGYWDGSVDFMDDKVAELTGYDREPFNSRRIRWTDLVHPDDVAAMKQVFREALHGDRAYVREYRIGHRDGHLTWIQERAQIICDEAGQVQHIDGVFFDITTARRLAEELQRSEARFRAFMDNSPTVAFMKDKQGRYVYVNPAWERLTQKSPAEWLGKTDVEVWPPQLAQRVRASDQKVLEQGHAITVETLLPGPEGTETAWWVCKFPLPEAAGEAVVGGMAVDITERRRIAKRLDMKAQLLELVNEIILEHDPAGKIIYVNETGSRKLGYAKEDLVGQEVQLVLTPASAQQLEGRIRELQEKGSLIYTSTYRRADGVDVPVEVSSCWVELEGQPAILNAARELGRLPIGEAKLSEPSSREAAGSGMEAVGRLAGGVAHGFNNLLTAILGYADLVRSDLEPGDPRAELVTAIVDAAQRGAELTQQLLAVSSKQLIQPRQLNLSRELDTLKERLRQLLEEDIALETVLADGLRPVLVDPGQIEQIIVNLALNAQEAMPQGGRLRLETANVTLDEAFCQTRAGIAPGDYVCLTVQDSGQGMDAPTRAAIFEPFFTTKARGLGAGLGLATVYGIVKQNHGHIEVSSAPGQGSTFRVYLPVALGADLPGEEAGGEEPELRGTETILVVEDDPAVLAFMEQGLKDLGYHLLVTRSGPEAVQLVEDYREPVHLLLVDVALPDMDGLELGRRLRLMHPEIQILGISGYTVDDLLPPGTLGVTAAFLAKPFTLTTLAQKVRQMLDSQAV